MSAYENFYDGIKNVILTGLEHDYFKSDIAGRIGKFYGISRNSILVYDQFHLGYFDERSASEIEQILGAESIYWDDDDE